MGGRLTVVGLLAVAVAVLFASELAAPSPATAQISIPLPGSDSKPKVVQRKRYFRPTLPNRNPTRVTAGVSAAAVSPPKAANSTAAIMVGTSSSASVALVLAPSDPLRPQVAEAEKDTATTDTGVEDETTSAGDAETSAEPDADIASTGAVETALSHGPPDSTEEGAAATQPASDDTASEAAKADSGPAGTANDAEPVEIEEVAAEEESTPVESAETAPTESVEESAEDATLIEIASVESPALSVTESAPESALVAPETAATEEPSDLADEAQPDEEIAEKTNTPSQGPSVVLEVSPPPDELLDAATKSDAPSAGEATEKAEDTEEIKIAALTPPSAPSPAAPEPDEAETSEEVTPLDTAPSEAEATDEEEPSTEAGTKDSAGEKNEAASSKTDTSAGETSSDALTEPSDEESVAEEAAPPPPPPAHPVVASIRTKLAEADQHKSVAASDLEALKELYGAHEEPPLWVSESGFSGKAKAIIAEIGKADDWGLEAASFDLPSADASFATEDTQADAELELSIAILSYARDAQLGRLTPSRVSKLFDQHPTLRDPKQVLTDMAEVDAPDRYLISLHPQHTQFKRLQAALVRARDSAKETGRNPNADRNVQLIVINMERWRWMPRQLGNLHVWNNVPEFNVRVLKGGKTIYHEKTIVGQYKYATPFFSAPMRNIVFHPNWTVPPTIIREDLAPKLQGPGGGGFFGSSKEAILRRYGLQVSYKGERISADSVDWKNVNIHAYTFTQDPGPANVLGQFKFNFPNKHAIYMHDTPQRHLFAERTRTLSHGCIRVKQPDRLVTLLLAEDKGWSSGHVRNLVAKGPNSSTVISLKRHVSVHLTYFTAVVDERGGLNTFGDIYNIDNRIAPKLFDNPARFPVPAAAIIAESNTPSRSRSRPRNGVENFISGLFGN